MGYLGEKNRNESVRFTLSLDVAPTGTPTVRVYSGGSAETLELPMIVGASTLEWHYDYTTGAAATVGSYEVKFTAVIDGVTRYSYDYYDQSEYDPDAIKAETALIKAETDKIQTIDNNVDTSLTNQTSIEGKVDIIDTVVDAVKARTDIIATATEDNTAHGTGTWQQGNTTVPPTVTQIDTELTTNHGTGAWTSSGAGTGAYNATINVKDGTPSNVANAYVTIHNASDDDAPIVASGTTDSSGSVTLNLTGNLYVRVSKAGFNFTSTAINVTASGTYNVTGTALSIPAPSDPDLCRLYIYPITLSNQDVTDLTIEISATEVLTKINGEFVKNSKMTFSYDATTTPDSYYFDALQGAAVYIFSNGIGLDHDVTVPAEATKDLNDLIT